MEDESHDRFVFDPLRTLLEDFEDIGGVVLVARDDAASLRSDILAVLTARLLGNKSVDYVRRTYVAPLEADRAVPARGDPLDAYADGYLQAYRAAKRYVVGALNRLQTLGKREPTAGEFASSVALERLPYSFFCAHLLYRLGHGYEGHAVSRHILEQISWASAAAPLEAPASIRALKTTKTVRTLTEFYPLAGRLYGFLSDKTHVDYSNHLEFIDVSAGVSKLIASKFRFAQYAEVLLILADAFVAVWESSQLHFISAPEAVVVHDGSTLLAERRGFAAEIRTRLSALRAQASGFESSARIWPGTS